jgi:hypothetical protein
MLSPAQMLALCVLLAVGSTLKLVVTTLSQPLAAVRVS